MKAVLDIVQYWLENDVKTGTYCQGFKQVARKVSGQLLTIQYSTEGIRQMCLHFDISNITSWKFLNSFIAEINKKCVAFNTGPLQKFYINPIGKTCGNLFLYNMGK